MTTVTTDFDDAARQRAIEELGILDTPRDERIDRVTRIAQEMFGVPMVSVTLLDRDRQWRKSEIGLGGGEAPREDAFCDFTVREGRAKLYVNLTDYLDTGLLLDHRAIRRFIFERARGRTDFRFARIESLSKIVAGRARRQTRY